MKKKLGAAFDWLRYRVIIALAGDMPLLVNMTLVRPKNYAGKLFLFPRPDRPGIFHNCRVLPRSVTAESCAVILPSRDVRVSAASPIVEPTPGERSRILTSVK